MIEKDLLFDEFDFDNFEQYSLRQEALEHYEQALLVEQVEPFERFIQNQLLNNPFHLGLLYDLTIDLQQQLSSLQQYLFENRKRLVQAISQIYQTDISSLLPLDRPNSYAFLFSENIITRIKREGIKISTEETSMLREMVGTSNNNFRQILTDITITLKLLDLLHDWLSASSLKNLRQAQIPIWDHRTDGLSNVH